MALVKTAVRIAVIGGLATGAAVLVAGPQRVAALAGQAREAVVQRIDKNIKDPVALRAQLRTLEAEYPRRIASVRGDLAELNAQLSELQREKEVSDKVVALAAADLEEMKDILSRADAARTESPAAVISVRLDESIMTLDQAYSRATQINNTVQVYTKRSQDAERDAGVLAQQQDRLAKMLTQLETERAQFQTQLWQLEGQIETIARNERLINMVEERQAAIDRMSRYDAVSLDHVTERMERIRAEQESRLQSLSNRTETTDYEKKAQLMLESENVSREVFRRSIESAQPQPGSVIEIGPSRSVQPGADGKVAMTRPIVID